MTNVESREEMPQRITRTKKKNIGLTIPGNWPFEIRRISPEIRTKSAGFHLESTRFHEIHMKSGGFHLKSTRFHEIRTKSAGFHECELLRDDQV